MQAKQTENIFNDNSNVVKKHVTDIQHTREIMMFHNLDKTFSKIRDVYNGL